MSGVSDQWTEFAVDVSPAETDLVGDALREFGAEVVTEYPAIRPLDSGNFQYEELDAPTRVVGLTRAPVAQIRQDSLRSRLSALTDRSDSLTVRALPAIDWSQEWRRFYQPERFGTHLLLHPSWEQVEPAPGDIVVSLDPGEAFGTGQHATTRLCLEALEEVLPAESVVLDVGCGSGILSVFAARMGAARVQAIDIDPVAVRVTTENAVRNGVGEVVEAAQGSLGDDWPFEPSASEAADLLALNISADAIIQLATAAAEALRPGGVLVASGFIARDADAVLAALGEAGLEPGALREAVSEDWRCVIASRPAPG
jgi:ribosomal protein L11 methyltransferase